MEEKDNFQFIEWEFVPSNASINEAYCGLGSGSAYRVSRNRSWSSLLLRKGSSVFMNIHSFHKMASSVWQVDGCTLNVE